MSAHSPLTIGEDVIFLNCILILSGSITLTILICSILCGWKELQSLKNEAEIQELAEFSVKICSKDQTTTTQELKSFDLEKDESEESPTVIVHAVEIHWNKQTTTWPSEKVNNNLPLKMLNLNNTRCLKIQKISNQKALLWKIEN